MVNIFRTYLLLGGVSLVMALTASVNAQPYPEALTAVIVPEGTRSTTLWLDRRFVLETNAGTLQLTSAKAASPQRQAYYVYRQFNDPEAGYLATTGNLLVRVSDHSALADWLDDQGLNAVASDLPGVDIIVSPQAEVIALAQTLAQLDWVVSVHVDWWSPRQSK